MTVTASGPSTAQVFAFEFGIPAGATGPQGPQGIQGEAGATGAQGPAGEAAGFGTPTATATELPAGSDPTVTVTTSGPSTATVFDFAFGIPAAAFDGLYASAGSESVDTATIIPITQTAATPGTTLSVAANAVSLPVGTYLVNYGASGTSTTTANLSVQLYENGSAIANETISDNATDTGAANVSKTIIYTAAVPTTLSIYNVSGQTTSYFGANITVLKLA